MHKDLDPPARVRLDRLCRSFREGERRHTVLREVTAAFAAGETVALRGRSGSGKSTLLNVVAGIDRADSGTVHVEGSNLTAMDERSRTLFRRRHIGFVYQSFNLVPTLTVADNIRLVLELNGVAARAADARIEELLEAVMLKDRKNAWPELLSGGEQQRVAIARAVAHRPMLLLADEPTGNLDERTATTVLALLERMRRDEGATLIMATHSPTIAASCDRTLELRDGLLTEAGR